eukprot:CAMPEP_0115274882 /NCGR_PEP_ID=MMETSP0270-20121206/55906_1 /TAXON_ID=71861 /ORGANISM="Scrippsiella trochoidea, Strain CCMP3099" /LENGTH=222 /DNA_ID=CAMNT_0002691411 /DNA_START=138 /DNA_END=806 /DNA_ORIENTATION=+
MAHKQRREMLDITGEDYVCCAGACKDCKDEPSSLREPCLCLEACCCLHAATYGNRYMMRTRFDIRKDRDEPMQGLCCDLCAELGCELGCREFADLESMICFCCTCHQSCCLLTQQQVQLRAIRMGLREQPYNGPPARVIETLPPKQQSMVNAARERREAGRPACVQPQHLAAPLVTRETNTEILVPADGGPRQEVQIATPEGPRQAVVPEGVTPGQQLSANV